MSQSSEIVHYRRGNTVYASSSTAPLEECLAQLLPQGLQRAPQISLTIDIPSKAYAAQELPDELQFEYAAARNKDAGAIVMAPVFLRGLARQWENVVGTWPEQGWDAMPPLGEMENKKGYVWGVSVEVVMPRDGQWEEEEIQEREEEEEESRQEEVRQEGQEEENGESETQEETEAEREQEEE